LKSTENDRRAIHAAAIYLEMRGYTILELHWRRAHAEVDIIATKSSTVYFIEVTHHRDIQTSDLVVLTSSKLQQLHRAAFLWIDDSKWTGTYQLGSIELSGPRYSVMSFSDDIS